MPRIIKLPILYSISCIMQALRPIITEETHVHDRENVLKNYELTSKPCLWLFKHETTLDPVNLIPLWRKTASLPDMKIVAKHFNARIEKVFGAFLKPFILNVHRPNRGEGKTEEERKRMKLENQKKIELIKNNYLKGTHCIMMPEGTTETDGTVFPIKSGCYNLSFIEHEGSTVKIPIIPVGLTYDPLSGRKHWLTGKRRNLVFINIGKPFTYEKSYDDIKQDIKHHKERVMDALIDCNTVTAAQLAGEYLIQRANEGRLGAGEAQLQKIVAARAEGLSRLEGLAFDKALLDREQRRKRVGNLYEGIQGYFADKQNISLERVLLETSHLTYKRDNALRYCANRLIQAAERRADISEVLERTRD